MYKQEMAVAGWQCIEKGGSRGAAAISGHVTHIEMGAAMFFLLFFLLGQRWL